MKTYLVDSCRRQDAAPHQAGLENTVVAKLPQTISTTREETPLLTFNKDMAIRKFENIMIDLFFNSPEHYRLIEIGTLQY